MRPPRTLLILAACCCAPLAGCLSVNTSPYGQSKSPRSIQEMGMDEADDFDRGNVSLSPETHLAAGRFAENQGRTAEAVQQYERALQLDPEFAPAIRRIGLIQSKAGDWDAARHTWNRYVTATNGSAEAYNSLGYMLEKSGDPLGAESAFLKGLDDDPDHKGCRVNYGLLLARQDRLEDATGHLAAALPMPAVLYNLGAVHEQQGKLEDAAAYYREALDLDPTMQKPQERLQRMGVASIR